MDRTAPPAPARFLVLAVVVLVGLNLRPFITGVGPIAGMVGADTGLGLQGMALFTLVPMLLMGGFAFAGPSLEARVGARRSVVAALAVLGLGSFLRLFVSAGWQMVGTAALLGVGAAVVQAVFPGIIKREFPRHVGVVTGLYSAMMMGGGALGAQAAPLIAGPQGDWHAALSWMAAPAFLAVLLAALCLPRDAVGGRSGPAAPCLLGRPRVWLLMACFGLVNGGYSTVVAWLAPSYQELGWTGPASGALLATLALFQAVSALMMPVLAGRRADRRPWLWLTLAMQVAGFAGLALAPAAHPLVWVALLGAGLGGCFSLTLVVALDHLPDPAQAGALSALMQGGGFLLAAIPPWIVASLRDLTGGFAAGWLLHLGAITVVAALTLRLAPRTYAAAMLTPPTAAAASPPTPRRPCGRTPRPAPERGAAVAGEGRPVHQRQRARREAGKAAERRPHPGVEARVAEEVLAGDRRSDHVAGGQRRPVAELGEEVAAHQRAGRLLVEHAGVPAMRGVRGVDEADALAAAEVDHLAVAEHARRPVGEVVQRHHDPGLPVRRRSPPAPPPATRSSRRTRRPRNGRRRSSAAAREEGSGREHRD